jgi:putative tricarboxylic transport membrane protein
MKHLVATALLAARYFAGAALPTAALAADYSIMAPAGARRRLGSDRPLDAGSPDRRRHFRQRAGYQCAGRRRHHRPRAVRAGRQWRSGKLIVGGYVMVGAILTNKAPVTLDAVTPIARLTGEYEVIVVPAASDIQDLAGLVAKLKADPGSVSWAGGSAGGTDHITAGLFAKTAGVDPKLVNYVAFSGGGEALAAVLGSQVTVGISGYGEFQSQVEAGALRVIGVSAPEKVAIINGPTFKEGGVDLVVQNWRGVWAGPGLSAEQTAAIGADIEKMVNSAAWKKILETKGWINTYLPGDEFKTQLATEITATEAILKDIGLVQ